MNKSLSGMLMAGTVLVAPFAAKAAPVAPSVAVPVVTLGGAAILNDSSAAQVSGVAFNGVASVASTTGIGSTVNTYGTTVDLSGHIVPGTLTAGGLVSLDNSVVTYGVSAVGVQSSYLGQNAAGLQNVAANVGLVDQGDLTIAASKAPTNLGFSQLTNSSVGTSDVAVGLVSTLAIDSDVGAYGKANNYGGYDRVTLSTTTPTVTSAGFSSGSTLLTGSKVNNVVSAFYAGSSAILSSTAGAETLADSVGQVTETTFTAKAPVKYTPNAAALGLQPGPK